MSSGDDVLQLASRYQTLRAVSVSTTHEFRDSLNAITVNTELLAHTLQAESVRPGDGEVQQRCLRAIRQELGRMAATIGRVLEEGRDDGRPPARVSLGDVTQAAVSLLSSTAAHQGVVLQLERGGTTIEVMGRARDLRQVIMCLAVNALEAMPTGGVLTFGVEREDGTAVLTISDTGPGVPPDLRERIWEPRFSTKPDGPGIGLNVAREVTAAYGGGLTLEQSDRGARFALRFPVIR